MSVIDVARVNDIPLGTMRSYHAQEKDILISNIGGKFYAIPSVCTHAGGDLSKGVLEGKIVTCPRHGARFDVTSGECLSGPKIAFLKLKTKNTNALEVRVDGNSLKVDV